MLANAQPTRNVLLLATNAMGHLVPTLELAIQLLRMHGDRCHIHLASSAIIVDEIVRRAMVPSNYANNMTMIRLFDDTPLVEGDLNVDDMVELMDKSRPSLKGLSDILQATEFGKQVPESASKLCDLAPRKFDLIIVESFRIYIMPHLEGLSAEIMILWTLAAAFVPQMMTMGLLLISNKSKNGTAECAPLLSSTDSAVNSDGSGNLSIPTVDDKVVEQLRPELLKILNTRMCEYLIPLAAELARGKVQLINSFEELELKTLTQLRSLPMFVNNKIRCVGPLSLFGRQPVNELNTFYTPTDTANSDTTCNLSSTEHFISNWLTTQSAANRHVVYISFGSIYRLSQLQITEFIIAIRSLNNVSFLWSLHNSLHTHINTDAIHDLIHIFSDTTPVSAAAARDKHVLVMSWVPQAFVLIQPSIRAFITHCGWNSTLEAISAGVPLICWPLRADQPGNAAFITSPEIRAGVLVENTLDQATETILVVPANEIASKVREVLGSDTALINTEYYLNARRIHEHALANTRLDKGISAQNIKSLLSI